MAKTYKGIDLSRWNGSVDMKKVRASGIDFAIVQSSYGNVKAFPNQKDSRFDVNVKNARSAGLDFGVYHYMYATTTAAAKQEAEGFVALLNKVKPIPYFVALDIEEAAQAGVDAFIIADLGVLALAKKYAPGVERHVSTQAGITNYEAAAVAYELGAKRVVLARELPLTEIAQIRDNCPRDLELEAFVHGAMCMSVSGRCLLSSYMTGRSGNRGECAQPCRWKYALLEEHRPGQYMEIGESENGSYILNANDLCTAPFLDLICKAGVDSLKIEGRAKTFYYVASVTSAYRRALDAYLRNPYSDTYELPDDVIEELNRTSHRHYSPGFYFGKEQALQTPSHTYVREWDFIGTVDSWADGVAHCTQRGKFSVGDKLEVLQPDGNVVTVTPTWIENEAGERVDATPHPMMAYTIPCETPLMPYSLLRMHKAQPES